MRSSRPHEAGQAIVELTLVVMVLMLMLVGAVDLGRVFYSQITITNAAKEGVLVASRGGSYTAATGCSTTNTVMCATIGEAKNGLVTVRSTDVDATTCPEKPAADTPPVSVTVSTPFRALTPFISAVLGGDNVTLSATATQVCAYVPAVALGAAPTPPPTPTAAPTPTPAPCTVPVFINKIKANQAQKAWNDAGFVPANLKITVSGSGNPTIGSEAPTGSDGTKQVCATFTLTVVAP